MMNHPLIMVVDDEQTIRSLIKRILEREGFGVIVANNGRSALNLLEEHRPDLTILDIMMPELDGFQALSLIRQRSNIPVIILTAMQEVTTLCDTLGLGADDYIRKPFNNNELLARIRAKLRSAAADVIHAQEDERQRISADLHDGVAQWLVGARYQVLSIDPLIPKDSSNDKARDALVSVESTLDKSLEEMRRVLMKLRPPDLDRLGLSRALAQGFAELVADGIDCRINCKGTPVPLPSTVEIALYRVVQEALNNVRKHACATKVNLGLQFDEDKVMVKVRDNGRGFDVSHTLDSAVSKGHIGLLGMKQRVEMLGGDITIETREGGGTTIAVSFHLQLPVTKEGGLLHGRRGEI